MESISLYTSISASFMQQRAHQNCTAASITVPKQQKRDPTTLQTSSKTKASSYLKFSLKTVNLTQHACSHNLLFFYHYLKIMFSKIFGCFSKLNDIINNKKYLSINGIALLQQRTPKTFLIIHKFISCHTTYF